MRSQALRADVLMLITAVIWGAAFVAQSSGMDHIGPFLYTGLRFALACLVLLPVLALLQRRLPSVAEVRATVPVVMVVAGSVAIAVLAGSGQIDSTHTLQRWAMGLPVAAVGVIVGNRLARHIPPPVMRRTMAVLLVVSGLSLTRHLWL